MIVDYSRYQTNDIVKIQAFVRGALCRARVEKMVQKWIDEILTKLGRPKLGEQGRRSITGKMLDVKKFENGTGGGSSRNLSQRQLSVKSMSSSNDRPESFNGHGSVSSMLSIFEANSSGPVQRSWSSKKFDLNLEPEEKQEDKKQSTTIEEPELAETGEKDPESPSKSTSHVKNIKLVSNATNHVSSSEKKLEEHERRMNEEIQQLLKDIRRLGEPGKPTVEFGTLFDDEQVSNYYEALVGTLKAARKKKLITYEGQYLLKGMTDRVVITII